jgi:hypothetical protein
MNTAELIYQEAKTLPDHLSAEVLACFKRDER